MQRYLIWKSSGRTVSTWASSEAEAWFKYKDVRHVKLVETQAGQELRSSVELARELSMLDANPLSG